MILVGDIGGTKTHLALFSSSKTQWLVQFEATYPSKNYASLEEVIQHFLAQAKPQQAIQAAGFGVAGPVIQAQCKITNLPWIITVAQLQQQLPTTKIFLINDLESIGLGIPHLPPDKLIALNPTATIQPGNQAIIAAGTGLGESLLYWDGNQFHSIASEGGHVNFAPRDQREMELLHYWQQQLAHVSYEHVLSGPGLFNIYQFLKHSGYGEEPAWLTQQFNQSDPSAVIAEMGLSNNNKLCVQALDMLVSIYGAAAGNLALKFMALGGVYLGGGIAPKIVAKLQEGTFMRAFTDKGRFAQLLNTIPVYVILDPKVGLWGAAGYTIHKAYSLDSVSLVINDCHA
jgi:glucokinase